MSHQDSARIGKAVEHLVAATCILTSGLELNVSTALVDDEGVDLVFHRRGASATLAVQVKSRTTSAKTISQGAQFHTAVRTATFRPRVDLYLLFVPVDADTGTFPFVWLVPSNVLARRPPKDGKRIFRASMKETSKDQWSEFRVDREELARQLLHLLDRLAHSSR